MSAHRQSFEAHVDGKGVDSALSPDERLSEKPKTDEAYKDASVSKELGGDEAPYDDAAPVYSDEEGKLGGEGAVETNEDLLTRVIHVEDDPSLNPWTFRVFFLGMNKQSVLVSTYTI
jgi:hypothetical protein